MNAQTAAALVSLQLDGQPDGRVRPSAASVRRDDDDDDPEGGQTGDSPTGLLRRHNAEQPRAES
jgi:hypothetical protein